MVVGGILTRFIPPDAPASSLSVNSIDRIEVWLFMVSAPCCGDVRRLCEQTMPIVDGPCSDADHTLIDEIDENQEKKTLYEVTTTHGEGNLQTSTYLTHKIVLAVGPWAPALYGSEIPVQLHVERRVQFWFQPINPNLFKVYFSFWPKVKHFWFKFVLVL